MTTRSRAGFTLVELIVVTVLGSLVLLAALQVLVTNQRAYTAQNAAIQGQQGTRMALDLLFGELREASPAGGDILMMAQDSVRVRLMRKLGIVCEVDLSLANPMIKVLNDTPGEPFEVGDSVLAFADNYENDQADDVWIDATVATTDDTQTCFVGTEPATELTFDAADAVELQTDSVRVGAPIRSYEIYTFLPTFLFGDYYLGRRARISGVVMQVPVAGPIRGATDGVEFTYLDALGNVTAVPTDVRQIVVKIRTGGTVLGATGGRVSDSITAWIYTRN